MSLSKHSTTVIYSLFLTVINYIIAYLLSSKEVLFDFKNIGLIFLFSYIWLSLYKLYGKKKNYYLPMCYLLFNRLSYTGISFQIRSYVSATLDERFFIWIYSTYTSYSYQSIA